MRVGSVYKYSVFLPPRKASLQPSLTLLFAVEHLIMAAVNPDTKHHHPSDKDDSSMETGIPTGEKIGADHVERLETANNPVTTAGVRDFQIYENMASIAELGLPDWRATEKQLVRRLDMSLMPTIWLLYFNNYLDRTNIAQARLAPTTIDESLGLSGEDYNIAVSVLTAGKCLEIIRNLDRKNVLIGNRRLHARSTPVQHASYSTETWRLLAMHYAGLVWSFNRHSFYNRRV